MRTAMPTIVGIAALALLAAPTGVALAEDATEGGPGQYLSGTFAGLGSPDYDNPLGCPQWVMPDGTELPTPSLSHTVVGETTLLGRTTFMAQNCQSFTDPLADITNGVFTMIGENGDELSGTWDGDCAPGIVDPGVRFVCFGDMEVTGGTGAFDGATGRFITMADWWNGGFTEDGLWRVSPTQWFVEGLVQQIRPQQHRMGGVTYPSHSSMSSGGTYRTTRSVSILIASPTSPVRRLYRVGALGRPE